MAIATCLSTRAAAAAGTAVDKVRTAGIERGMAVLSRTIGTAYSAAHLTFTLQAMELSTIESSFVERIYVNFIQQLFLSRLRPTHYRCEVRKEVGDSRGGIGAIR